MVSGVRFQGQDLGRKVLNKTFFLSKIRNPKSQIRNREIPYSKSKVAINRAELKGGRGDHQNTGCWTDPSELFYCRL